MERASTVDNPASHCITLHRRDGYDLLPISAVMRWAPDVPGHRTQAVPRQLARPDGQPLPHLQLRHVARLPEATPSVAGYAADLASRPLGSLDAPPEAASVYGLPITSFRFEWLVVW